MTIIDHVLQTFLPERPNVLYHLRERLHNKHLSIKQSIWTNVTFYFACCMYKRVKTAVNFCHLYFHFIDHIRFFLHILYRKVAYVNFFLNQYVMWYDINELLRSMSGWTCSETANAAVFCLIAYNVVKHLFINWHLFNLWLFAYHAY